MLLDGEARRARPQGGVYLDLGHVEVELLAPHEPGLDTPWSGVLKERPSDP
jgi:hypothetical protein